MSKQSALAKFGVVATPAPEVPAAPAVAEVEKPETEGTETPDAATAPEPEAPKSLDSTRFAALAKKEAELVRQQQELKKERESIQAERDRFKPIADQYKQYEETKAKDPIAALKIMGFSEADIVNYMAAQEKPELTADEKATQIAERVAEEKLKAYREGEEKRVKEEQDKRDADSVKKYKGDITSALETEKDKLEYCAYMGEKAVELAYAITLKVLEDSEGKEMLTIQEALEEAEKYYEEEDQKMSAIKKRQPKAKEPEPEEEKSATVERTRTLLPSEKANPPKPVITKTRTLSNAATATVASSAPRRPETRDEKRERLAESLRQGVYIKP